MHKIIRAYIIGLIVDLPVMMFIFPMIQGLSFTGGVWKALLLAAICQMGAFIGTYFVAYALAMVGIIRVGDSKRRSVVILTTPQLFAYAGMLMFMNGKFTLHVASLGAALVGTVVCMGAASILSRLLRLAKSEGSE